MVIEIAKNDAISSFSSSNGLLHLKPQFQIGGYNNFPFLAMIKLKFTPLLRDILSDRAHAFENVYIIYIHFEHK